RQAPPGGQQRPHLRLHGRAEQLLAGHHAALRDQLRLPGLRGARERGSGPGSADHGGEPTPAREPVRLILFLLLTGLAVAEPVEIEFWHAMRGQRTQVIERLAERFHQANPDVTVRPRLVIDSGARLGNDYSALYRTLLEAIARGNPPTVAQVY